MIIKTLVENNSISPKYKTKHGLSLYIKTKKHNILFDVGEDELFLENAKKLDVDIKSIDIVIISHGHKDHGGALKIFLDNNDIAKVYVHKDAFNKYYSKSSGELRDISLDAKLKYNERIILSDGIVDIDDGLTLFSGVDGINTYALANRFLYTEENSNLILDNFSHEQNLIVKDNNKWYLFAGCAHCGIVNIKEKGENIINNKFDYIVAGAHLKDISSEDIHLIDEIAVALNNDYTHYYTCHCTGKPAYLRLKKKMGTYIDYINTGSVLRV